MKYYFDSRLFDLFDDKKYYKVVTDIIFNLVLQKIFWFCEEKFYRFIAQILAHRYWVN